MRNIDVALRIEMRWWDGEVVRWWDIMRFKLKVVWDELNFGRILFFYKPNSSRWIDT